MAMGWGVVVRFKALEALLVPPLNKTLVELKLHAAPAGAPLQVSDTLAPNAPCGVHCTVYGAVWPATTVWLDGLIDIEKPPAVKEALADRLVFVLLILTTDAVASNEPVRLGVTTKFTVDVEPACSVGIRQTTELRTAPLQLPPEVAVALLKATSVDETAPFT